MFLLTPISNYAQSSERLSSRFTGEHVGEHPPGPCVQAASATSNRAELTLNTMTSLQKSVHTRNLREPYSFLKGGVFCRLRCRRRTPNSESGRERPRVVGLSATRLLLERCRSRPDLALNLPHDVGQLLLQVVPQSRAPLTDTVARLGPRPAWSFAIQGGPAAWH
jgi:hypothetical protein